MNMLKTNRSFIRCVNGVAAIEFVLFLPILMTMFLAVAEISRYAIIHQKLSNATRSVADLVTRSTSVSLASLDAYADAVDQLMQPFAFNGTVIFSSVASTGDSGNSSNTGGGGVGGGGGIRNPQGVRPGDGDRCPTGCVMWQAIPRGSDVSAIGHTVGQPATLPQGYDLEDEQNVIVVELVYHYTPMLSISQRFVDAIAPQINRSIIVQKPRQNTLLTPPQ